MGFEFQDKITRVLPKPISKLYLRQALSLPAFFLDQHVELVDSAWRAKLALSAEIMASAPLRAHRPDLLGDRTRVDFLWTEGRLGIQQTTADRSQKTFLPIRRPDSVHLKIVEAMEWLEANPLPIAPAQVRFRLAPSGKIGFWIDASNENIKALLEEQQWIHGVLKASYCLEMGQRSKTPVWKDSSWKLTESTGDMWLSSYSASNEELPARFSMALFSQPGPEANRSLIALGMDLLDDASVPHSVPWCEWGAGYGNLSLAFATRLGASGLSSELDPNALPFLEQNLKTHFPERSVERLKAGASHPLIQQSYEVWILDPPRPGFPELLSSLQHTTSPKPQWILVYHCHSRGLLSDTPRLRDAGYRLHNWSITDVFPATPHVEVISLWQLK
jgi:hypothetical protein